MSGYTVLYGLTLQHITLEGALALQDNGFAVIVDNGRKATIRRDVQE